MGRLILRRGTGESLTIGDGIHIEVVSAHGTGRAACTVCFKIGSDIKVTVTKEGRHVKFMIEAPEEVVILRDELQQSEHGEGPKTKQPSEAEGEATSPP